MSTPDPGRRPPAAPTTVPRAPRYRLIEAWRGFAALAVLSFHSFGPFVAQPVWRPLEPLRHAAGSGWLGLHLFFVISGYCIFERLALAAARREPVKGFLVDRFLRIFPTYWAILAFSIALNVATWPFNRSHFSGNFPGSPVDGLADVSLTHVLFGTAPFVLVSWTLTCEASFYLLAGFLLLASRNSPRLLPALALGFALCGPAGWVPPDHWTLPLALWPDFFAGTCVAVILRAWNGRDFRWMAAGLAALGAVTAMAALGPGNYGTVAHRVACGFAWVLLGLHPWDGALAGLAPVRWLAAAGAFSYSLYLIHVQILTRVINLGTRLVRPTSPGFGLLWLVAVAVAVAGGWYFWRVVELRCEQYRHHRLAARRTAAAARPAPLPILPA
jgi:exopolysaccharide production protein ExoZ